MEKMMNKYNVYLSTGPGKIRDINEDSFSINEYSKDKQKTNQHIKGTFDEPILLGVFDGMGGEKGGFDASNIAASIANSYYKYLKKSKSLPENSIINFVKNCNKYIKEDLNTKKLNRGGTTFSLAYIYKDLVHLFSMGDSRIYLFSNGVLRQLSRDHTLAQKKYEANIFTKEEANDSSESHVLTRFLGMDSESTDFKPEVYNPVSLNIGDKLLICSDGLYDMCSDKIIEDVLSSNDSYSLDLFNIALQNGGIDNITCLVVEKAI